MSKDNTNVITGAFNTGRIELDDAEKVLDILSDDLLRSRKTLRFIAQRTGLCTTTVSKMMYRETRYPRVGTVMALLQYFGYKVYIQHK